MKKTMLIIGLLLTVVFVAGCCTTHYTPVPTATIGKPPTPTHVKAQVWLVTDPATGKQIKYIVIPADQLFILKANKRKAEDYMRHCYDLIGEKD